MNSEADALYEKIQELEKENADLKQNWQDLNQLFDNRIDMFEKKIALRDKEICDLKQQLHDTPKEYNNAFKALAKKRREHINHLADLLYKKNIKLKELNKQLSKQKHLSEKAVGTELQALSYANLAYKPITKEKIISVLKSYFNDDTPNKILNAILSPEKEEVREIKQ